MMQLPMLKRAFLIDDDDVFRTGFDCLLREELGIDTVHSGSFDPASLEGFTFSASDLLVLSPPNDHFETLSRLEDELLAARTYVAIIVFEQRSSALLNFYARLQIDGLLIKPCSREEVSELGAALRQGKKFCSAKLRADIASPRENNTVGSSDPLVMSLSEREVEILRHTAGGRSSAQIAFELGISVKTAERYRRSLFTKLEVDNVAALTKFALREGLTSL